MNNKTFSTVNRASALGFTSISDSFVPNMLVQQSTPKYGVTNNTIVLHYNESHVSGHDEYRVSNYHATGEFKLKGGSSASGELGKLQFVTIGEGEDWEHEAVVAGKTIFRKKTANGYPVPSQGKYELVFSDPYEFGIFLNNLKRCEYQSGQAGRCYPFGFTR